MFHFFINESGLGLNVFQTLYKVPGLGKKKISFICRQVGILWNCPWSKLTDGQIRWLAVWIEDNFIGNNSVFFDFRKIQKERVMSLKLLKTYKGVRLSKNLPANGQNTHSNAKTAKRLKI